jgi:L-ascorbate metabolism protein UlaG (beta-lactamase superfamily)
MKISKHLHSCLLIENLGTTVLIDPGIFTYNEKALDIASLQNLHYILITHEHPDHMHIPFIQELLAKFPDVKIITNPSAANVLERQNITSLTEGNEIVTIHEAPHEKLWDVDVPQNMVVNVFNRLTHPGDSLHLTTTNDILCLPIQAPWGSTTAAVEKALELKPKIIIPIHDWMWKDDFRTTMYQRLTQFFAKHEIDFKSLETGQIIEV